MQYHKLFCFRGNHKELNDWAYFYGCHILNCLYLIPAWIAVNEDRLVVSFFVLSLVSLFLASVSPRQVLACVLARPWLGSQRS